MGVHALPVTKIAIQVLDHRFVYVHTALQAAVLVHPVHLPHQVLWKMRHEIFAPIVKHFNIDHTSTRHVGAPNVA